MRKSVKIIIAIVLICLLGGVTVFYNKYNQEVVFNKVLDSTAITVDGNKLTFSDMAFYVSYEEDTVQKQAVIYDASNPSKYWNAHINGNFIRVFAKNAISDMAIHDEIYYQMAVAQGIEFSSDEETIVKNKAVDFYNKINNEQREAVGASQELIYNTMYKMALAEKMTAQISSRDGVSTDKLAINGELYLKELENHKTTLSALWKKLNIGKITVNIY